MKKMKSKLVVGIVIMLVLTVTPAVARPESDPFVIDLIAGQFIDVGDVSVWNDEDNIYVKYETTGGWVLNETHVHFATSFGDIPQTKKGSPKIGHFDYKTEHDPPVQEYTYVIPYDTVATYYFAAHAVVYNECLNQEETAWGQSPCTFGVGWAMYRCYFHWWF